MVQIQIIQYDMPAPQALATAQNIIKQQVLAKEIGVFSSDMKHYIEGTNFAGKKKALPMKYIESANVALTKLGNYLINTHITPDDPLNQLKTLGKTIRLTRFLQTEFGWTECQLKMRMSRKQDSHYGKFTAEELQTINTSLIKYAVQLLQIHVVADK